MVVKNAREIAMAGGDPGATWWTTLPGLAVAIPGLMGNALIVAALVWMVRTLREPRNRMEPPSLHGPTPADAARGSLQRVVARWMADRANVKLVLVGSLAALGFNLGAFLIGLQSVGSPAGFEIALVATSLLPLLAITALASAAIAFSPLIGAREELIIPSTPSAPPRLLFDALDSASIAMGAKHCRLHMVESPGVNAFVDDTDSRRRSRTRSRRSIPC